MEGKMMVNLQPDVNPAGRYTVTEACKLLGIHRATLNRATNALFTLSFNFFRCLFSACEGKAHCP